MSRQMRGFVGMLMLVVLVIVWSLFFMALAQGTVQQASKLVQGIYYVVAGLGWVVPAAIIIKWIEKKPV
jgi:hypothetical protein